MKKLQFQEFNSKELPFLQIPSSSNWIAQSVNGAYVIYKGKNDWESTFHFGRHINLIDFISNHRARKPIIAVKIPSSTSFEEAVKNCEKDQEEILKSV